MGAASDLYLGEKDLIAEITASWTIFLPNSIFKQERGCACVVQISQIEEFNGLGALSCIGTCAGACQKMGQPNISTITAFGIYFCFGVFTYIHKASLKKSQFYLR